MSWRISYASNTVDYHLLMIASDRIKPGLIQPLQNQMRARATINEITRYEQAVYSLVKTNLGQQGLKHLKMPMNIPNDKITPTAIDSERLRKDGS